MSIVTFNMQDVLDKECGSAAICFVSFLPDILDSKAEGRNKYLTTLRNVAEKFKRSAYRQVTEYFLCCQYLITIAVHTPGQFVICGTEPFGAPSC